MAAASSGEASAVCTAKRERRSLIFKMNDDLRHDAVGGQVMQVGEEEATLVGGRRFGKQQRILLRGAEFAC